MLATVTNTLRNAQRYSKNEDGAVAVIFGLTTMLIFGVTGLAIDVGRMMHSERKLEAAIDAAALAGAKAMRDGGVDAAGAEAIARNFFERNLEGGAAGYATIKTLNITIDTALHTVTVDVDADVRTTFGGVAGVTKISIPKTATAGYESKDIEMGLQLDVTGSMSGRKLADLKDAVAGTNGLFDILLPPGGTTNKVRIGLAPYASGVNAGDYAMAVSDRRATNGCVYERLDIREQTSDIPATGTVHRFKARSDLTGSSIGDCPSDAKVKALTNDRVLLRNTVNSWRTSSATAGHLGTAWAWYLVSPEWAGIWPAASAPVAYGERNTMKVTVLMTDGIYNTVGGRNTAANEIESARLAVETCSAMKAKGVIVYTVGFEVPASVKPTLISCASDPSKFFDARDGDALRASFRSIAIEVNNLRLTN